ncbi:MAG: DUF2809 domain-containing protein [Myxococcales bacterium]|nr:DUF2809 domain-containing protein [Myxococcales bacterium]
MRRSLWLALAAVTPLGFATKLYRGPGATWVANYGGGVVYEIFWILLVLAIAPRWPASRVAIGVLLVTCGLEGLQLWHPPALDAVRSTGLGRALVGSTFSWWDFPHYAAGCALGVALVRLLAGREKGVETPAPTREAPSL